MHQSPCGHLGGVDRDIEDLSRWLKVAGTPELGHLPDDQLDEAIRIDNLSKAEAYMFFALRADEAGMCRLRSPPAVEEEEEVDWGPRCV